MQRTSPIRFVFPAFALLSTSGCLSPAAWTADGYTVDESRSTRAASIMDQCFRLLLDADIHYYAMRIKLGHGEIADVSGRVEVLSPLRPVSDVKPRLPKGSTVTVAKVLLWRNVETSSRTPYVLVDGALIDAGILFRDTGEGEGPRRIDRVDRLLEPCTGGH